MQAQSISLGQSIGLSGRGSESDLDTRLHSPAVNPRLEKRLKDFAEGGLCLLWKRQSMYAVAALLCALYVSDMLAIVCMIFCEVSELFDYKVSKQVTSWRDGTQDEAVRYQRMLLLASTLNACAVSAFCIGFALLEGPVPHQLPLFILFAAGLFAAVNNHQVPQILYVRLVIYGAAFLFIPIYDLVMIRPPLDSPLWLQMATVLFVLYFVIECAQIFLQLYQRGLDQMEALRDERDRARAAYEVKSQFVSVVSHELRTPLTSISGSLDLLRSGLLEASSEQAGRVVDIAWQNSKRLKALINDLLDLQKLESGTVSYRTGTENLSDIASEAVQSVAVIADKSDVKLALDLAEEPLTLQADRARLMQVFANLLSNAIKFSNGPNTVTLKTWQDGKTVHASIQDRGIGIPEGSESVVFGKFGQVDSSDHRKHEGTGLGLSIVRQIVEAHEGTVSYTSVEGEGTTFTISFPARD